MTTRSTISAIEDLWCREAWRGSGACPSSWTAREVPWVATSVSLSILRGVTRFVHTKGSIQTPRLEEQGVRDGLGYDLLAWMPVVVTQVMNKVA